MNTNFTSNRALDGARRMLDATHTLSPVEQLTAALSVACMRLAMIDPAHRPAAVAAFKHAVDSAMIAAKQVEMLAGDPAGRA